MTTRKKLEKYMKKIGHDKRHQNKIAKGTKNGYAMKDNPIVNPLERNFGQVLSR